MTKKEKEFQKRDQLGPLARKASLVEHQRKLEKFDRFNQDFVDAYKAE